MQQNETSFLEWMSKYHDETACLKELARRRWPDGFKCPRCGHRKAHVLSRRQIHECASKDCKFQSSVTSGTVFEHSRVPLPKWFAAIALMATDKGGVSALRLSKQIKVHWNTARLMLRKLRTAMAARDREYQLCGLVELDDAYVGGRRKGKRGRGAAGKKPVLFAVQNQGEHAGFMAAAAVERIDGEQVRQFITRLDAECQVRTDACKALNAIAEHCLHEARVTPPEMADSWLPKVHKAISNFKRYLLGTYHGVSHKYLQEYIDEFVYRYNRRNWEPQLPERLLELTVNHAPIRF